MSASSGLHPPARRQPSSGRQPSPGRQLSSSWQPSSGRHATSDDTVAVVTDGAASLPDAVRDHLGIRIVPMAVVLGDEVRRDHELSPADILDGAARGPVTTSAPSPGDYLGALGELRDRHVVVLTVARGMSASYESAKIAAGYLEKRRAAVVDTQTAAGGQGLVVMAAARAARAGAGLDDVAAAAQRVIRRVHLLASLDRLDHLATSGRVPKVVTLAGRSVGMRAIFEFSFGRARVRMPARNADSAVARIVAACGADDPGGARLHAAVLDAEAPAAAEALMDAVQHLAPRGEIYAAPFSSVMVAHTGPGLAGLAWWWEPREELVPTGQHVAGGETG